MVFQNRIAESTERFLDPVVRQSFIALHEQSRADNVRVQNDGEFSDSVVLYHRSATRETLGRNLYQYR